MEDLKTAACREGKPQWGDRGPQNAGCYNSLLPGVPFFEEGQESFLSDYGRFFLVRVPSNLFLLIFIKKRHLFECFLKGPESHFQLNAYLVSTNSIFGN